MAEDDSKANSVAASPLSGGYLLVVLAEPSSEQHKQALLQRLAKGKFHFVSTSCGIGAEKGVVARVRPPGQASRRRGIESDARRKLPAGRPQLSFADAL